MVLAMKKLLSSAAEYWHWPDLHSPQPKSPPVDALVIERRDFMIGAYRAEYAPLTEAEVASVDEECKQLFEKSRPVP